MKVKCAIFDFDGTLFDSMYLWDSVGEIYLRSQGKEPKPSMREDVRALSLYQSACYFREEYNLALSPDEIMDGVNRIIEGFYLYEVQPKPGVIPFLEALRKTDAAICIATALDRYQIEAALARCGMDDLFDGIFTCTEVGHGKDEPDIFRKAMEFFHADRSNTVVFEDAIHAVRTAKKDGFAVAAVFDPSETRQMELQQLCDCYLTDFAHTQPFWDFISAE